MMAANYRHIGGGVNRLGRHYSRFSGFWPMASVVDQSLALRKSQNRESNRRRRVRKIAPATESAPTTSATVTVGLKRANRPKPTNSTHIQKTSTVRNGHEIELP